MCIFHDSHSLETTMFHRKRIIKKKQYNRNGNNHTIFMNMKIHIILLTHEVGEQK